MRQTPSRTPCTVSFTSTSRIPHRRKLIRGSDCLVLSKTSPHVHNPPAFALHIALHFTSTYPHITKCFVDLQTHKWSRIQVDGKPHGWAFERDGDEKGVVEACADASAGKNKTTGYVKVGLKDLLGKFGSYMSFCAVADPKWVDFESLEDYRLELFQLPPRSVHHSPG